MRLLKIYNEDLGVDVQYKTDLITDTQSNFTVMSVDGLDEAEEILGIAFQKMPYTIDAFKAFAEENGFGLSVQTIGSATDEAVTVLVEPEPGPSED